MPELFTAAFAKRLDGLCHLDVREAQTGDRVLAGQVLVKIPRAVGKSRDITGGLPRVTELFEARNPSNPAIVAEIDGVITFGAIKRGNREAFIKAKDGQECKYLIPLTKQVLVQSEDFVRSGTALTEGTISVKDILSIRGPFAASYYLVNGVQEVYRSQGITINNKHIEVIVRQMMRRVKILEPGDTNFLAEDHVERKLFRQENQRVTSLGGTQATAQPLLLGITKASLSTESFISASSFQETTKVLTEAALQGKVDYLRGLKENVIMGRLIPAGTGIPTYKKLTINVDVATDGADKPSDRVDSVGGAAQVVPLGEVATGRDE